MLGAGLPRDASKGTRRSDGAARTPRAVRREIAERLPGQNDDISTLAAIQTIKQPQCRREIGIDARASCRFISSSKIANRTHQGQRREQANDILHRQSFVAALRAAPASAVASSSPLRFPCATNEKETKPERA